MNYKQQFSQILETQFSNCEKSILVAIEAGKALSDFKDGFFINNDVNTHAIEEVHFYSFTSSIIKNSFLVTAYSFFEYSFRKYCEIIVTEHSGFKRKLSDMDKVYQYHSLVTNILPLSESVISEDWGRLVIYREIRNIIVHHNSIVPGNTTSKTKLVLAVDNYIDPENSGPIKISGNLIKEMLDVGLRFLLNLIELYDKHYPEGIFSDNYKF
ncbi:MAG: hypothetical protein J7604_21955 [Sporocytophaga sp.]|uniref:hypothetical protein n=1 Tax=Sporocytophaga sp. TaxID=2231183 RepID=UPI001AFDDE80|nr:hypothetical protein [Sporocytophaga sp.]MBO9702894.1 hypothetical protein [Sporocytophaga sp.]